MNDVSHHIDDILFSLKYVARADRLEHWDDDLAESILNHFGKFAEQVIAPLNRTGDAEGARLIDGSVRMPAGFKDAYRKLAEGGWQGLSAPEKYGGQEVSELICAGVSELFSAANHSMQMVCNLVPGAISTLIKFGNKAQQEEWIPRFVSGEALSTMCLTEAGAGSDLSAIQCKATRIGGQWRLSGEKIFISGGDQDMSNSIMHLVLARSGSVEDGLGGLSLFLCPAQSDVRVLRIEKKCGLHASPTCQLLFEDAAAELVGAEGEGLRAMFAVMNHARIDVALQGVAHSASASRISKSYAQDRIQGRNLDKSPAFLSDHADVNRMLLKQESLAVSARSMCHLTIVELALGARPQLVEFLTPLCKVAGSRAGIDSADLAIQVLGGYGYLKEYGVEQIWRDARITAIYEGANGIHERSLVTRGLRPTGGADQFGIFVQELGGRNVLVEKALSAWLREKNQLMEDDQRLNYAHDFTAKTISLFRLAIWTRISTEARHHPQKSEG